MMLAEIHGKCVPEAQDFEDYLTSTVFEHLRYIPPGPFWRAFLQRCRSLTNQAVGTTAFDYLRNVTAAEVGEYETLQIIFWPKHPKGIPDVVLIFTDKVLRPIVVCIEAKLFAAKSGLGNNDQLARYLQACDSVDCFDPPVPTDAASIVLYLTTHDSRGELSDSLEVCEEPDKARLRLYGLEWQDIIEIAEETSDQLGGVSLQIVQDVAEFLKVRNLVHFVGMTLPLEVSDCAVRIFAEAPILSEFSFQPEVENIRAGWLQ